MITTNSADEGYYCDACNSRVKGYHRFCYNCGEYLGSDGTRIRFFNNHNLRSAFIFLSCIYLFALLVQFTNWFDSYDQLFWVEIFLAAFTFFHVLKIIMQ